MEAFTYKGISDGKYVDGEIEALNLDEKEWSGKVIRSTMHTPGSPIVAQRIWPP